MPNFDQKRGVDGERTLEVLKPLPVASAAAGTFEIRQKVLGVYDKGKPGSVIETETLLVERASGEVYSRVVGSGFMVGQGGWGGPKGGFFFLFLFSFFLSFFENRKCSMLTRATGPKSVNYPPPEGKKPDATFVQRTTKETAHLYR